MFHKLLENKQQIKTESYLFAILVIFFVSDKGFINFVDTSLLLTQ